MNNRFQFYKKVKHALEYNYKGYPIQNIISVELACVIFKQKKITVKTFLTFLLSKNIKLPEQCENKILYSLGPYNRNDYREILDYVRKQQPGELVDFHNVTRKIKVNFKNIINSYWFLFFKCSMLRIKEKFIIAALFAYAMNIIDEVEKNDLPSAKCYVSFCSSHFYEAILDFFFQKHKVPTLTLQHGLYFLFEKKSVDSLVYENFISNKLLCWGGYTRDEFIKHGISNDRIIIAGYPRQLPSLYPRVAAEKRKILVLLARKIFEKNNIKMLEVIAEFKKANENVIIELKLHPSLDVSFYQGIVNKYDFRLISSGTLSELLQSGTYDLTLSYNSTAYYDSYMNNCISLRYLDDDRDGSISVMDDGFRYGEDLNDKVKFFSNVMSTASFWNEVEERLEYIIGYKINRYKEVIVSYT